MKKLLSLLLVAIMLFACVALAIPASAADWIEEVEAYYFDKKPYIDGYITEAEWGEPTTVVRQSDAVTVKDSNPGFNRFFYKLGTFDDTTLSLEYTLWLRWDENYFYVGVKAKDPDGHSLKNGRGNTWDGDAFQCRIDPDGSNAAAFGGTFSPDMTSDGKPWSSSTICDLQFGYCEMAGGFSEAFDYINQKGMTATSNNPLGVCEIGIAPAGYSYSADTANGITTYEIAIPWSYIEIDLERGHEYYKESVVVKKDGDGNIIQGPKGAINREYGMSAVVLNADGASGARHFNALLSWGSGVCTIQQKPTSEGGGYKTCGGSNAVVLSGTKVSEAGAVGGYATYTLGGVPSKPVVANYATEIDKSPKAESKWEYKNLTYDNEDDMSILGWAQFGERVQDETGNWVVQWDKDTGDTPFSPTESGLSVYNYLCTEGDSGEPNDFRYASQGCSYTMEFDVRVTGTEQFESSYDSALYTWFGGPDAVSFACGYFFDDSKFIVAETQNLKNPSASALASSAADFSLNEWHHWVFQYDDDTCVMRFYFDPAMEDGHVAQSAVPMFNFRYRYFDYGGAEECILILRRMNCQIQLDNVQMYNFVDWTKGKGYDEIDPDNGGGPSIIEETEDVDIEYDVEQLEDGSFALSVKNDAKYAEANVTAVSFAVNYDAEKLTFKGVDTISADDVEITDDGNGKAVVKIKNLEVLKKVEAGELLLRVLVAPKDGVTVTADEVAKLVSIKASITTLSKNTGDSVIYIGAALVIVLAVGTAVVIYRRKKNTVEF